MAETTRIDWQKLMEEALTAQGNMGNVYNRFHEYSLTNMFLFMMQGVREPVASMKRWNSLGRQVIKGSRAKEVIVPLLINEKPKEDEPDEEKKERIARLIGFKVVRGVFALSDTDGEQLPPAKTPGWDVQTALQKLAIKQVPFQSTSGNVQGYSIGREIAVNPVAAHPLKTMIHEIGHIALGHTVAIRQGEYSQHRGIMEFGAESTAYLVMNELGQLDEETASHSRGYIRHWLGEENPGDREIRLVFAAAEQILRAGRVTPISDTNAGDSQR